MINLLRKLILKIRYVFNIYLLSLLALSVSAESWITNSTNFNDGTYYNTYLNTSINKIALYGNNLSGHYESVIFDASQPVFWNYMTFCADGGDGLGLPDNQAIVGAINMHDNELLYHLNELNNPVIDTSSNNNNATGYNVSFNQAGIINKAIVCNGSSWLNVTGGIPQIVGDNSVSAGLWVKPYQANAFQDILIIRDNADTVGQRLFMQIKDGYFLVQTTGAGNSLISKTPVIQNEWTHYFVTVSGTTIKLYINGLLSNTSTLADSLALTVNRLTLCRYVGEPTRMFNGSIDEVSVYSRVLSDTEIYNRYLYGVTNVNVTVRSCDDNVCYNDDWNYTYQTCNVTHSLYVGQNRYFQYNVTFNTLNSSTSPLFFQNVISYTVTTTTLSTTSTTSITSTTLPPTDINTYLTVTSFGEEYYSIELCNHIDNCTFYSMYEEIELNGTKDYEIRLLPKRINVTDYAGMRFLDSRIWNVILMFMVFFISLAILLMFISLIISWTKKS